MEPYQLRTDVFEGPLELLLALIEKRKLLINDIALAEVTDDYLKYLEQHPDFPVAETAQFVLVGSTLLLIKSKSLLPVLSFTPEEQESMEDLGKRLFLLEKHQATAKKISELFGRNRLFNRSRTVHREPIFSPDNTINVAQVSLAMRAVLAHLPLSKPPIPKVIVQKVASLEDMMQTLTTRINESMRVSFRDATKGASHKVNVIVTFLAMLELVRQGVIRVEQEATHGDITMHMDSVSTPRYT